MMDNHGLASDNGFLPQPGLEREISKWMDGIEDEDGNKAVNFLAEDREDKRVVRPKRVETGVKGVLNDKREAQARWAKQQTADRLRTQVHNRMLAGSGVKPVGEPKATEDEEFDDDEDDEDDEEFLKYRAQRLQQMQQQAAATSHLPTFGHVEEISVLEYVDKVDNPGHDQTFVVVLLWEDYLPSCVQLVLMLQKVAAKYDQVRFLSVCAHECNPDIEDDSLPTLIAYQSTKYLADANRVGRDGIELSVAGIEDLIRGLGVRLTAAAAMRDADAAALQRLRELGISSKPTRANRDEHSDEDEDEYDD